MLLHIVNLLGCCVVENPFLLHLNSFFFFLFHNLKKIIFAPFYTSSAAQIVEMIHECPKQLKQLCINWLNPADVLAGSIIFVVSPIWIMHLLYLRILMLHRAQNCFHANASLIVGRCRGESDMRCRGRGGGSFLLSCWHNIILSVIIP